MITAEALDVVFNAGTPLENHALRGVTVDIPEGQWVTVIGSNGAGKSTLLNALSGEARLRSGRLLIGHEDVTRWPPHKRASLVARVFQDPLAGTCERLTIAENMALALRRGGLRGLRPALSRPERATLRERLARLGLGLENRLDDRMGLLSGGQRQAVSLLMATLAPMRILLLDEHTAALDPRTADLILRLTQTLIREGGLTALMVTHSMRQALALGDRTLMLHEGRVVLDLMGSERAGMTVEGLLAEFSRQRGEELDDDALLLG
ncbi:ABC transporter ATP-binding protein [Pararhodospirillum oryzae]|uniref:ABC transporter ATP-binding protein n=1 Tax=Pararhodospirillum oryzae TaxID=478448 RepID=A0A512H7X7_9PROT|nr:ABC transporter ATP-binding protein [Pararhodospirillum oryzae]GEO81490.1 ABC transporter ATP-binding protein [Pararhodospirillum oryzae]